MPTCFVCLNPARRKVCTTCKCYAHNKCWGQYLQSVTNIRTVVDQGRILIVSPYSIRCPQCRGRLSEVRAITRSDTNLGRNVALSMNYAIFLTALDLAENDEEKHILYKEMLEIMTANKLCVRNSDQLTSLLKSKLKILYIDDDWEPANLYHHLLFGTQIAGNA